MDNETIVQVYRDFSSVYDLVWGKIFEGGRVEAIRHLGLRPGQRVLEVGVGSGLTLPLYPPDCEVVGIDISPEMLARARVRIQRKGLRNVTLKRMDACRMAFADDCFDAVLAAYVLTVVPDPDALISEIKRVCKRNGKIVFLNHFESSNPWIARIERAISPFCARKMAFRTDISLSTLLRHRDLDMIRKRRVPPLNLWKVVELVNVKPGDQ